MNPTCPSCGYCPACKRANMSPYVPFIPYYPWPTYTPYVVADYYYTPLLPNNVTGSPNPYDNPWNNNTVA